MKKFISVIMAAVLTASIGFSFAGCGKKEQNAPAETSAERVEDIRVGFISYETDENVLRWENTNQYSPIITDNFGLGKDGATKFFANSSSYYAYGVSVEIVNNTDSPIEITGIETTLNGSGDVYIRNDFNGSAIGVEAHSSSAHTLQVICLNEDASDEQVIAELFSRTYLLLYTQDAEEKSIAIELEESVEVYDEPSENDDIIRFGDGGFVFSEALWEKYKDDTEANRTALKTGFGVSDDFVNTFYKDSAIYNFFNYPVLVQNMSEHDIVILDITTANDGTDGIYVNVAFNSEMGIPAYDPDANYMLPTFAVQVLCDNDDLSDEEVQNVVNAMEFNVTYAEKAVDGDPDSEELKEEQTITVTIG